MTTHLESIDKLFEKYDTNKSPGGTILVVQEGEILHKKGYGNANLEFRIPNNPETVFHIGSLTKQFTAMCIALLEEDDLVTPKTNIRSLLPELPESFNKITVENLIYHTSGLQDIERIRWLTGRNLEPFTYDTFIEMLNIHNQVLFKPGTKFEYSNTGYFLLSIIIEKITGQKINEFANERIFVPLNMENTQYVDNETTIIQNLASAYYTTNDNKYVNKKYPRSLHNKSQLVGPGFIVSNINDLYQWCGNFINPAICEKSTIEKILTSRKLNSGEKTGYGYGLYISNDNIINHAGGYFAYGADFLYDPNMQLFIICLSNVFELIPYEITRKVQNLVTGGQEVDEDLKAEKSVNREYIEISSDELENKLGTYRNDETGSTWTVLSQDDNLFVKTNYLIPIKPTKENIFYSVDFPVEIRFEFKDEHIEVESQILNGIWKKIELFAPSNEKLQEYKGKYYSEILDVHYEIIEENNELKFGHFMAPTSKSFTPTLEDEFEVKESGGLYLKFIRNKMNMIKGFELRIEGVKPLNFSVMHTKNKKLH